MRTLVSDVIVYVVGQFDAWETAAEDVFHALEGFYNSILAPVGNAIKTLIKDSIGFVVDQFNDWKQVAQDVFNGIEAVYNTVLKPVFDAITKAIQPIIQGFKDLSGAGSAVSNFFGGIGKDLGLGGTSLASQAQDFILTAIKCSGNTAGRSSNPVADKSTAECGYTGRLTGEYKTPATVLTSIVQLESPIPEAAAGGIFNQPTLAVIGEQGPEAVVPLKGISTQQPLPLPNGGTSSNSAARQVNIYVTIQTVTMDGSSSDLATAVKAKLQQVSDTLNLGY